MSRSLTSGVAAAVQAPKNGPTIFAFFDFASGPVYVWSGIGPVTWNGHTWQGLGQFGNVSGLTETVDTQATGPVFTLSGAPSSMVSLVFADNYNGRTVKAWIGMRNPANDQVIADPYPIFVGRMDAVEIARDDGTSCDIAVHAESKNYAPNQADDRRFNHADQQIDFPGDTGFVYLASQGQRIISWGQRDASTASGAGTGKTPMIYHLP